MDIITWILLGLLSGFIGSKLVDRQGMGMVLDIVLGIVGAFVGGYLFRYFGHTGVTGFNFHSILVAVVGSVIVLSVAHFIRRVL